MSKEIRLLSTSAILGYGFPEASLQGLRSAFALDMVPEPGNGREAAEGYAGSPFDSSMYGLPVCN